MIFKTKTQRRVEKLEAEVKELRNLLQLLKADLTLERYTTFSVFEEPPVTISLKVAVTALLEQGGLEIYHNQGTPAFTGIRKKAPPEKFYTPDGKLYDKPTPPKEQS